MDFEVSIDEHAKAYSVIAVRGEVDLHTAPKVEYAIERAAQTDGAVVVDMSGVAFMDSTALGPRALQRLPAEARNLAAARRPIAGGRAHLLRDRLPRLLRSLSLPRGCHTRSELAQWRATPWPSRTRI